MKHGSVFTGEGGFDLASEWMGWENVFHCEWKEFNQKILKYYWPNATSYSDITKTDFSIHRGTIDILTGGFPCQPYSVAGKRKGTDDERHLWPEMLRAVREIQPPWVVGENVRGLINWNGGLVFEEVQADLEAEGYEVQPFLLPAAGVNAPHERYRIWFVAYSDLHGHQFRGLEKDRREEDQSESKGNQRERVWGNNIGISKQGTTSNSDKQYGNLSGFRTGKISQFEKTGIWVNNATNPSSIRSRENYRVGKSRFTDSQSPKNDWEKFPTQSPICNGDDGLSSQLDSITFSKWRTESIMSGGNAIVPQVALQIFKAIEQYNKRCTP